MNDGRDRGFLLYAVGVFFGLLAVLYFSFEIVLGLSPTVKAMLLLSGFLGALVAAASTDRSGLSEAMYALSAASYLAFALYVYVTFDPGQQGVLALLGLSSALFLGLGYAVREASFTIGRRGVLAVLVAVVVVAAAGVAVDMATPGPTYTVAFENEIELDPDDPWADRPVGTVVVENPSPLSRTIDSPRYVACAYTADGVQYGWEEELRPAPDGQYPDGTLLRGGESISYPLYVPSYTFIDDDSEGLHDDFATAGTVPIETADGCPERTDGVTLVVAPQG